MKSHYSYLPHLKHLPFLFFIFILVSCEFEKTIPKPSPNRVVNRNTGEFDYDHLYFNPNLHIESSNGFDFTDSTISHISQEQATLTTTALQFNTPFHTIHSVYEVTDLIVPIGGIQDHLEKLEMYFRLGTSEDEWTDWHSLSDLRGNDDIEMRFLYRYNPSRFTMFNNTLFDYAQIKLISNSENYGKMIAKELKFSVLKFGSHSRSKKKTLKQLRNNHSCDTPFNYLSRFDWGLTQREDDENRRIYPAEPCGFQYTCSPTISHIYLHCSDVKNNNGEFESWDKLIKAIWHDHTYELRPNTGVIYGDIGYHWIIDPDGVIYEGRANAEVGIHDPSFHVCGSHISEGNSCSLGILLLSYDGCFYVDEITDRQYRSLMKVTSYFYNQNNIENSSELALHWGNSLHRLSGHRDWAVANNGYRICPGDNVYNNLSTIRSDINVILDECNRYDDSDTDSIPDYYDNCSDVSNPDQADWNNNGIGDACEDSDGDGVLDINDNCWTEPGQPWIDSDGDGIEDDCDNCPTVSNANQYDMDGDGLGNVCDNDLDGDGVSNDNDNCPEYFNPDQNTLCENEFPEGDSTACDDSDIVAFYNQMKSCIDGVNSSYSIQMENNQQIYLDCKHNFSSDYPRASNQNIINDKIGNYKHLAKYNCKDIYDASNPNPYFECYNEEVCSEAIEDGWDSNMANPSVEQWEQYLTAICPCVNEFNVSKGQTMIQHGTLALQCFTPMGEGYLEWCDPPEKDMAIYSKPYWYNIINKGNGLINLFEERDCSDISFPPILTLECEN